MRAQITLEDVRIQGVMQTQVRLEFDPPITAAADASQSVSYAEYLAYVAVNAINAQIEAMDQRR